MSDAEHEQLLRDLTPRVLAATVRRHGQFDLAEDAVQEALLAAATQWPATGIPASPEGWLITVADRRMTDQIRSESARRRREESDAITAPDSDVEVSDRDDTVPLLIMCCHPALTSASQIALTLRAVGGLTTAEIARAFLVPEATMAQRISRAKQQIKGAGATFTLLSTADRAQRLGSVLRVLYLIFTEGHTTTTGPELQRLDLTEEAIRITRLLCAAEPTDGEINGLLALMLLTQARRQGRTDSAGDLVPLPEQDRASWDVAMITEGVELITGTLASGPVGPYQIQAAIAALHAEARSADQTDWAQIVDLYLLLEQLAPSPIVTLNRAVAVAMADGPESGLAILEPLRADQRMVRHHRLHAVRGQLLSEVGDVAGARTAYETATRLATSLPEQRHLQRLLARLPAQEG